MVKIDEETSLGHWAATRKLLMVTLSIWAVFAFVLQLFVGALNEIVILGFPLGYYMAAQGAELAFVILIFWFAGRQNGIDSQFGVAEDE